MSMYIPEIKEEVSENAKMLVEDGGKIVRTGMPSVEHYFIRYVADKFVGDDKIFELEPVEFMDKVIYDDGQICYRILRVSYGYDETHYIVDTGAASLIINKVDKTITVD